MLCMKVFISLLADHQNIHQGTAIWTVNLVIAYSHFNLPHGFVNHIWVTLLTLSFSKIHPKGPESVVDSSATFLESAS